MGKGLSGAVGGRWREERDIFYPGDLSLRGENNYLKKGRGGTEIVLPSKGKGGRMPLILHVVIVLVVAGFGLWLINRFIR